MASKGISTAQKFKTELSPGKIIASVFWDSGVIKVDFLPHDVNN
jgi:hypothetical protein